MTELATIGETLHAAARAHPTRRGWACGGEEITFAEMHERTRRLATGLGPLEDSVWPCGEGNLNGNPVTSQAC